MVNLQPFATSNSVFMADKARLLAKLDGRVIKCISQYGLISDGDKVLIGISGGKDSLALTELLARRARIFAPKFSLIALHVEMEHIGYKSDSDYLSDFCRKLGIDFAVRRVSFDTSRDKRKSPCFLCSWNRRKELFSYARQKGCNKIALGHHRDDILSTLIMNMAFQGSFSTMPPLLSMDKFDMQIIRPLSLIDEKELTLLSKVCGYIIQQKNCPFEKASYRSNVNKIISELEILNPNVRRSLWHSMENIQKAYLPQKTIK